MCRLISALIFSLQLVAGTLASAATASNLVTPGPLRVRDHFLLGVGFLALEPTSAEILEPGGWRVEAIWSVASSWAISPKVDGALQARAERGPVTDDQLDELARRADGRLIYVDGEVSRTAIAVQRGLGKGVQLEILLPLLSLHGGHLDSWVESFHDTLSLATDGRGGAVRDDFLVSLSTPRGSFRTTESPSFGLGDIVVAAKFRVKGDPASSFRAAVEAVVKLPTASDEPLVTSGQVDFGVQLLLGHSRDKWSFHGAAGLVLLSESRELGLGSQGLFSLSAGVERAFGRRTSLLAQFALAESPFEELATHRIDVTATYATLGLKLVLGKKHEILIAATENFETFTNTADLGLHFGISRRF